MTFALACQKQIATAGYGLPSEPTRRRSIPTPFRGGLRSDCPTISTGGACDAEARLSIPRHCWLRYRFEEDSFRRARDPTWDPRHSGWPGGRVV
jgi:hypothetical protein